MTIATRQARVGVRRSRALEHLAVPLGCGLIRRRVEGERRSARERSLRRRRDPRRRSHAAREPPERTTDVCVVHRRLSCSRARRGVADVVARGAAEHRPRGDRRHPRAVPALRVTDLMTLARPMAGSHEFPRAIAFYLPQFHRIPENDAGWGPGFTEWVNVVSARPLFRGHHQPHAARRSRLLRPARARGPCRASRPRRRPTASTRSATTTTGSTAGAFSSSPSTRCSRAGRRRCPFCLCWANEPWTRAWDGRTGETLIEQRHSDADDRAHARWLAAGVR